MLTTLLLSTILIGFSGALQPGLEYHYGYSGRVAMGVPEIRSQFAGAGLDADLYIQVVNRNKIMAKLMNVKVGEVHEIVRGDPAERLPMLYSYRNVENASLYLEYPVALYLTKGQVSKIEVPLEEPFWVSNLRFGVLQVLFSLDALKANLAEDEVDSVFAKPSTYSVMEDTIEGKCYTEYTLSPLSGDDENKAAKQSHRMAKDIQSTSSATARSGRKAIISSKYWALKKNVNYNKCKNKVMLKREVPENSADGPRFPSSSVSRSLYGSYVLQGGANGLRVDSAMLESTITLPGVSGHMEKLHTITNQSLSLESVEDIMVKMKSEPVIRTLNYQYLSNYEDLSRNFEEFLFGIEISSQDMEAIKTHVLQLLRIKLSVLENPTDNTVEADHVAGLVDAVEGLRLLDAVAIRDLYHKVITISHKNQDQHDKPQLSIFIDMLVMCGTEASIKVLLHIIDEAEQVVREDLLSDLSQALIADLHNPAVLRQLMEYSLDMSMEKEATSKSELLLSWSHMFHRLCVPPFAPSDDTIRCDSQGLLDIFIPAMHQAIKRSTSLWQKQVYVQSLSNLGHQRVFKHLQTLVENKDEISDARLRVTAVMGLNGASLTPTLKKQAVSFLSGLLSEFSEDDIVRQAAFLALLTWEPKVTVVQQVAESTWSEVSNQVATFITQTLYSLAKGQDTTIGSLAVRAIPLAKPARFNSLNAALNSHLLSSLSLTKPSTWSSVVFLSNTADLLPQDVYDQLQGLCLQQVSTLATSIDEAVDIASAILSMGKASQNKDTSALQTAKTLFNNIKDKLSVSKGYVGSHMDINIFGRLLKTFKKIFMLPSRYTRGLATVESTQSSDTTSGSRVFTIQMLSGGSSLVLGVPTALGMPHLIDYRSATLVRIDATLNMDQATALNLDLSITVNKFNERRSRTILPWSGKALGTGVTQSMALSLPLSVDVSFNLSPLQFDVSIHTSSQQFELLGLQSVPYTCIASALPVANTPSDAFKIIVGEAFPVYYERWNPLMDNGLAATQLTEADYTDPLITVFKRVLSRNPSMSPASAHYAKSILTLDMDNSAVTALNLHLNYDDESNTFSSSVELEGKEKQTVSATMSAGESVASSHGRVTTEYQIKLASILDGITQSEVCLGLLSSSPAMLPLDNLRDLLAGDVRNTLKAQLRPSCQSQEPLIEADLELRLSEFQAAMLHNDLDARATFSGNTLARYLLPLMLYDTAYATANWTQTAQNDMAHYANKLSDWLDDTSIPVYNLQNFRPDSTIRELNFDGNRKSLNGGWHGMAHVSGSEIVIKDLQLPEQVMKILAHLSEQPHLAKPRHLSSAYIGIDRTTTPIVFKGLSTHTCTIKQAKVQTFDGIQYEAAPSSCWSVAAMSLTNSSSSFAIQVKTEGSPMARLIMPQQGYVLSITPQHIKLNDETLSIGATETHITGTSLRVAQLPGGVVITNSDGLMIKLTKSVNIKVPISSSVGGICGNNDGVLENDLVGPRGCIFTSGTHLSMAWMDADETCVPDTYLAQQQETQLIQTYCPKHQVF